MVNYNNVSPKQHLKGIDILASIMQYCTPQTKRNILSGLRETMPKEVEELRKKVVMFEDLAYADSRGIQKLIKMLSLHDLALAVCGSSELLIKNLAQNLSQNRLNDFKEEIKAVGKVSQRDIENSQDRIMSIVSELIQSKELYISRPGSGYYV